MASLVYNKFKSHVLSGGFNFANGGDTFKVALVTSSYTADQDAHDFFDDITNEVSGTGYTAGGATIASQAVSQDDTNNRGVFDGADTSWTTASISSIAAAVVYKSTGTASTSPLVRYIDFGATYNVVVGTFQITWHADGILYIA